MNIHSTGNSGNKNRKWPRLAILATAALLLSAISFIGVGAIPQPQQAFAQNVTQSIDQSATQTNTATQSNTAEQNQNQEANVDAFLADVDQSQTATSTQSNVAEQSNALTQSASQVANVTGGS